MLLAVLTSVVLLFTAFAVFLYYYQGRLIFLPTSKIEFTPDEFDLTYEEIFIGVTATESIHAWYFPNDRIDSNATVIFCHGNAGNISHRINTARFLLERGLNVLMFDYRGFGRSDGSPTEQNVYADAVAAHDWLQREKQVRPEQLFIFGRSLGGAVAVDLATRVDCAGVVVESAFTSASDVGQRMYPFMPIRLLIRYRFDSLGKMARLTCPVLVAHSPNDDIIPYEMGQDLYEAVRANKVFVKLTGVHNDETCLENEEYISALDQFFSANQIATDSSDTGANDS